MFAIYIIGCIAVISYANFKENQRMAILYFFTYATAFFNIFRIMYCIILLLLVTFIFIEYLTDDEKKLILITKFPYKVADYIFLMVFQYHFIWLLISYAFLRQAHQLHDSSCQIVCVVFSIFFLVFSADRSISQPFKVKNISEVFKAFEQHPYYKFEYCDSMQKRFDMLCSFEDTTYFERKNSYSSISFEYTKIYLKSHGLSPLKLINRIFQSTKTHRNTGMSLFNRGFSTPEMQLLRTIGIVRGYDKYKFHRKIYEIVYSKIFFASLKQYHASNTYLPLHHYRHYLLSVYFDTVLIKIHGKKYTPFSSVFENDNISTWSMEGLFIACLGLSFQNISDSTLRKYASIIDLYGLDKDRILKISNAFPEEKLPSIP